MRNDLRAGEGSGQLLRLLHAMNDEERSLVSEYAIFHLDDPVQLPRTPFIMIYANRMETRIALKECLITAALSARTSK